MVEEVEEVAAVKDAVLAPDEARDPVRDAGLAQGRDVVSALGVEQDAERDVDQAQGGALDADLAPFSHAEYCHRAGAAWTD